MKSLMEGAELSYEAGVAVCTLLQHKLKERHEVRGVRQPGPLLPQPLYDPLGGDVIGVVSLASAYARKLDDMLHFMRRHVEARLVIADGLDTDQSVGILWREPV